jgi:hypothetical protein
MSDSLLTWITLIAFAIAGLLITLESGLVRRNGRTSAKPSDKPVEIEILDRWGAITLWVVGGLGAVALGFLVYFLLLLWGASRL